MGFEGGGVASPQTSFGVRLSRIHFWGGGCQKYGLKGGQAKKILGVKGGITKIILSSFAVTANNLPVQNGTKKTSISDVQPEVHIFYFLREACPRSPLLYYAQKNSDSTPPNKSKDHCVKNNVHFYNKKWNVS